MDKTLARAVIENILLVSNKPLTIRTVKNILNNELQGSDIKKIFEELINDYAEKNFQLIEIAGGYQLHTKFEYAEWIKRYHKSERASSVSRASLETLSIVAYKQPITRIEIEDIRGVDSGGTVRTLLEKNLIRMVGKKNVIGKPMMYGTSRKFLEYFGLRNLSDLPTLKEFTEKEIGESLHDNKIDTQISLPLKDSPSKDNIHGGDSLQASCGEIDPPGPGDGERQGHS